MSVAHIVLVLLSRLSINFLMLIVLGLLSLVLILFFWCFYLAGVHYSEYGLGVIFYYLRWCNWFDRRILQELFCGNGFSGRDTSYRSAIRNALLIAFLLIYFFTCTHPRYAWYNTAQCWLKKNNNGIMICY